MPPLPEELLEEIFVRLPPDEPACLVRASLASKLWLDLLTGPAFRGRYGEHHGAPPMLGFLLSYLDREKHPATHFVSTAKFGAHKSDWEHMEHVSLDCRHGRVLLADKYAGFSELAVWDPMTGCRRELKPPRECLGLGAAVLCAVTGCDHRSCHEGPFRVLLLGLSRNDGGDEQRSAHAWVCSSETEEWSEPCSPLLPGSKYALIQPRPSLLFENAIYHTIVYSDHIAILKYDMGSNSMSLLEGPPVPVFSAARSAILIGMENNNLGFTYLEWLSRGSSISKRATLCRWSRHIRSDGVTTWTQHRVVDVEQLIPIENPKKQFRLIGFEENSGIIFVSMDLGIYQINLKSLEWKKIWKRENIRALIPYMSFYHPPERATTPCKAVG